MGSDQVISLEFLSSILNLVPRAFPSPPIFEGKALGTRLLDPHSSEVISRRNQCLRREFLVFRLATTVGFSTNDV